MSSRREFLTLTLTAGGLVVLDRWLPRAECVTECVTCKLAVRLVRPDPLIGDSWHTWPFPHPQHACDEHIAVVRLDAMERIAISGLEQHHNGPRCGKQTIEMPFPTIQLWKGDYCEFTLRLKTYEKA